jgi:hypothetical protein
MMPGSAPGCTAQCAAESTGRAGGNALSCAILGVLEGAMSILIVAFGVLIAIWLVVLWGSRFLGPQ